MIRQPFKVRSIIATAFLAEPGGFKTWTRSYGRELTLDRDEPARKSFRVGKTHRYVEVTSNGAVSVRGASSIAGARRSMCQVARLFSRGNAVKLKRFRILNIVATAELGKPLDLERIFVQTPEPWLSFEPEIFPGLIVRFPGRASIALVFSSGRVVITGARSLTQVAASVRDLGAFVSRSR